MQPLTTVVSSVVLVALCAVCAVTAQGALRPAATTLKPTLAGATTPVMLPAEIPRSELQTRHADGKMVPQKRPPLDPAKAKLGAQNHPVLSAADIKAVADARAKSKATPTAKKLENIVKAHLERVDLFHRFPAAGTSASQPPRLQFAVKDTPSGAFVEADSATRARASARLSARTRSRQDRGAHTFPCPGVVTKRNMKEALIAAHLSNMAYSIGTGIRKGQTYPIPTMNVNITITDVLINGLSVNRPDWGNWADYIGPAFVGYTADTIYAAFRGSDSVGDWIYDFKFNGNTLTIGGERQGISHHGFTLIYRSLPVFDAVQAALRQKPQIRKVVFTGHSLGGGIAYLSSLEYALRRPSSTMAPFLFTFGAPRPGNDELRDNIMERVIHLRFKHDQDPVPLVPISGERLDSIFRPIFLYRHGSDASILLDDVSYKCFSDDQEFEDVRPQFSDHSIADGYIPALTRAYNGMT